MNASPPNRQMPGRGTRRTASHWRPAAAALRVRVFLTFLLADGLCLLASYIGAALIRGLILPYDTGWIIVVPVLVPIYLIIALNAHAYTAVTLQDPFRAVAKGLQALAFAVCATVFVAFSLKTSDSFPRLVVAIGTVLSIALLAASRYVLSRRMVAIVGGNPFSVVLLRDGDSPAPDGEFSVVIAADAGFDPDRHDPLMYDRLAKSLSTADRVIVACPPERRAAWAHALKGANIQSEIFLPELDALQPLGMGSYADMSTVVVANGPLALVDRFVKRGFDLVLATIALLFLAPVLLAVALAVKLDSRGPVLFRQTRIGRSNRMFRMVKFRSMTMETCDGPGDRSTARDDDRITRIGHFIRRTSLDELPQLLNIVKGDMSIVGPRPHALGSRAADKLFWEVDGRYWHRHAAKPGLTGLAQVRGYRGATLVEDDLRNRLQADLEYLESWSIWRDVKIIALTFRVLLHRNAF